MPCYGHRFAKNSKLIEHWHRWNMVQMVAEQYDYITACDWEIAHEHDGSMFETMEQLVKAHPDIDFHIAIGMDNANCMTLPREQGGWDRGALLVERFPFIVFTRQGVEIKSSWWTRRPHAQIEYSNLLSSSELRECIGEGKHNFAERHTNPKVWDYIVSGNLFGFDPNKGKS
jgi:nicotinic acid mononucleotide adenylyltransferase